MNHHHLRRNETLRAHLSAQYVLGTLRGAARRRFEGWLRIDATLAQAVLDWQARLHPMAELAPPLAPPARAWQAIERALGLAGLQRAAQRPWWSRLAGDLGFWRALGVGASGLAALLLVVLVMRAPAPGPVAPVVLAAVNSVATLSGEDAQPAIVVTGDAARRTLTVTMVARQPVGPGQSLQLWALPKQGAPQSLGLLAASGAVSLALPANVDPLSMPLLAVSLEPKGGSPNPHAPSGPVLYKGAWLRI